MEYTKEITIPANTAEASKVTQEIIVIGGYIVQVDIVIPSGHLGLAHLRIRDKEVQIYPVNRESSIRGDNDHLTFRDYYLVTRPYRLVLEGWNSDTEWDHTFLVHFTILTEQQIKQQQGATSQTIKEIQNQRESLLSRILTALGF